MFSEKSCRWQLRLMPKMVPEKMLYPQEIQDLYVKDLSHLRKETLYTMYRTYMGGYTLKDRVKNTTAQVQYWYGEKEMKCIKLSAQKFKELVPSCELFQAKGYNHGYLAIYLPDEWLAKAVPFFEKP